MGLLIAPCCSRCCVWVSVFCEVLAPPHVFISTPPPHFFPPPYVLLDKPLLCFPTPVPCITCHYPCLWFSNLSLVLSSRSLDILIPVCGIVYHSLGHTNTFLLGTLIPLGPQSSLSNTPSQIASFHGGYLFRHSDSSSLRYSDCSLLR